MKTNNNSNKKNEFYNFKDFSSLLRLIYTAIIDANVAASNEREKSR